MSLSYFNVKKLRRQSKQHDSSDASAAPAEPTVTSPSEEPAVSPVLDDEDERFLERLAALAQEPEGTPPPLPDRPTIVLDKGEKTVSKDVQEVIMDDADKVPLPMSPPPEVTVGNTDKGTSKEGDLGRRKSVMSYFSRFKKEKESKDTKEKDKKKEKVTSKDRKKAANDLHAAAEAVKSFEETEAEKEQRDLTEILDQLNLSAVNSRVFSFSKESEELLNKFKLVLKDVVNGVPTAYNDLEKLLTDSESQLKKMYGNLPPFLQNLVKSLPAKITATLGPELMAAQAEKPGFDAKQQATASGAKPKSKRPKIPSLKQLVSAQGAVATMLRSILNFLKLRFPALMTGTNLLLSLAVFLLLFVFWYCHKRGRETRLEKERLAAEGAEDAGADLASSASSFTDDGADSLLKESTWIEPTGESSKNAKNEKAEPPLVISDGKGTLHERRSREVVDMPSVLHLPNPKSVPLPQPGGDTPAKE